MYIIELLTPAGIWPLTVNDTDKAKGPKVAVFKELAIAETYLAKNRAIIKTIALGWRITTFSPFDLSEINSPQINNDNSQIAQ